MRLRPGKNCFTRGPKMRQALECVLLFLLPLAALADGKVYPPAALPVPVSIPDQRALIHYANGIERLVIETRFTGSGTNFAWVIPLPAKPVVEQATTGLFPTLQYLFQPKLKHYLPRYYLGILGFLGLFALVLSVRPDRPLELWQGAVCLLVAGCVAAADPVAGFLVSLIVLCPVVVVRAVRNPLSLLLLSGIFVIVVAMLLPVWAPAKSRTIASDSTPGVSIIDRQIVGVFETTTIASQDPQALQTWLRQNQFAVSTNADPVIAKYVRDAWVFVAAKLARADAASATSTPQPLSFTLTTLKPVYPMRLTGVDSDSPLSVELYIFGPERAAAAHFRVDRCAQPAYPPLPRQWQSWTRDTPHIVHPLLRRWVDGAAVVTKLSATLAPGRMQEDVWLQWKPFAKKERLVFSRQAALTNALNWGTGLFVGALLVALALLSWDRLPELSKRLVVKMAWGTMTCAGLLIPALYFAVPKTEVRFSDHPVARTYNNLQELFGCFLADANLPEPARAKALLGTLPAAERENHLLGGNIRFEDSPGNFSLHETTNGVEYIAYDAEGAPNVFGLVMRKPSL